MRGISTRRILRPGRLSALAAVVGAAILIGVMTQAVSHQQPSDRVPESPQTTISQLAGLDAQARCDRAAAMVTSRNTWPVECRWRVAGDQLQGQAFPPPAGDPPYDRPHIEIYVDPAQSVDDLARAIAHEFRHMHHARDPRFVPDWLAERGLPPGTPSEIWTEDYAEVFAALFGPPSATWRTSTPRPSADALEKLKSRFFRDA